MGAAPARICSVSFLARGREQLLHLLHILLLHILKYITTVYGILQDILQYILRGILILHAKTGSQYLAFKHITMDTPIYCLLRGIFQTCQFLRTT